MGEETRLSPEVFKAIHVDGLSLYEDKAFFDWAASHGLDRARVVEVYNSFGVNSKLNRAKALAQAYNIESVPTVIVDGKFVTSSESRDAGEAAPGARRIDHQSARRTREELNAPASNGIAVAHDAPRRLAVFVTGASSGIGAALARRYAAEGAQLGLFARRADALAVIAATLAPALPAVYVGDVRDAGALRAAAADFTARHGAADIVIASAGISHGTLTEYVEDNAVFRAILETSVLGMLHTFQAFLPAMHSARKGKLVGIASVAGFRGLPGAGAYSAAKAAAINYLESLRVELVDSGIKVITICPGYVATPMTAGNPYRMPFLLSAERAATLIVRAIAASRRFYILPWQMRWIGRLFSILPRPIFDRMLAEALRKPRAGV